MGGLVPITVAIADAANQAVIALLGGQRVRGLVVQTAEGLAVQAAGTRVPLPSGTALTPGQAVEITLVPGTQGHQLQISPRPLPGPSTREAGHVEVAVFGGRAVRGTVVATAEGLAVQAGGTRVALPGGTGLTAGQAVEVTLVPGEGGQEGQILLRAAVAGTAPGSASPAMNGARPVEVALFGARPVVGLVVETPEGLAVQAGGTRVTLPGGTGLLAGQAVEVALVASEDGGPVRISLRVAGVGGSDREGPSVRGLVSAILQSFGTVSPSSVSAAVQVVPKGVPLTEGAVRALLMLFFSRGSLGRDLATIARAVHDASAAGVLSPELAEEVTRAADLVSASGERAFRNALEGFARNPGKSFEGRMAEWVASGRSEEGLPPSTGDFRFQLALLRNHEGLGRFLTELGRFGEFQEAARGMFERLTGGLLQNLHGQRHEYYFVEMPMLWSGFGESAQVHFFGEGGQSGKGFAAKHALVVLDLSLTRLGDLWISLRTTHGTCQCQFRAVTEEAVEAIRAGSGELTAALENLGLGRVEVTVSLWDGDRLREMGALLGRYSGFDVSA